MVVVDLDGKIVEGKWQPSSDTLSGSMQQTLLDKYYLRKRGDNAYYG